MPWRDRAVPAVPAGSVLVQIRFRRPQFTTSYAVQVHIRGISETSDQSSDPGRARRVGLGSAPNRSWGCSDQVLAQIPIGLVDRFGGRFGLANFLQLLGIAVGRCRATLSEARRAFPRFGQHPPCVGSSRSSQVQIGARLVGPSPRFRRTQVHMRRYTTTLRVIRELVESGVARRGGVDEDGSGDDQCTLARAPTQGDAVLGTTATRKVTDVGMVRDMDSVTGQGTSRDASRAAAGTLAGTLPGGGARRDTRGDTSGRDTAGRRPGHRTPAGIPPGGARPGHDTSRATAGTPGPWSGHRPGRRPVHRPGTPTGPQPGHRGDGGDTGRDTPAARRGCRTWPGRLAHSFACTPRTTRTRDTTFKLGGSIEDDPPVVACQVYRWPPPARSAAAPST